MLLFPILNYLKALSDFWEAAFIYIDLYLITNL